MIETFPVMTPPSVTLISSYDHAGTEPSTIAILAAAMNIRIDCLRTSDCEHVCDILPALEPKKKGEPHGSPSTAMTVILLGDHRYGLHIRWRPGIRFLRSGHRTA